MKDTDTIVDTARFPRLDQFDFDSDFNAELDDFPRDAVPSFLSVLPEDQYRVALGAAWLAYNEGVMLGERDFVIPAAEMFADNPATRDRAAQFDRVVVEEELHILGSMRACESVRLQRGLQDLRFPHWHVADALNDVQDSAARRGYGDLAMLAICFTFEATISSSFPHLSRDRVIQPSHSAWVARHAEDETEHTRLFLRTMPDFFSSLSYTDQNRFVGAINSTLVAMCVPGASIWPTVGEYFGLRYENEVVADLVAPVTSLERVPVVSLNLHRALLRQPAPEPKE
ncbi:hypothetical protein ABT063_30720 [Streptomyces sp. NPDC002838]|uniref:hypothetical protein n=1 Tax=Streptomyces sp. NPDC002838 TaxID=3154436 RepID=UPI0033189CB0